MKHDTVDFILSALLLLAILLAGSVVAGKQYKQQSLEEDIGWHNQTKQMPNGDIK